MRVLKTQKVKKCTCPFYKQMGSIDVGSVQSSDIIVAIVCPIKPHPNVMPNSCAYREHRIHLQLTERVLLHIFCNFMPILFVTVKTVKFQLLVH